VSAFDVVICLGQQNLNKITVALHQRPGLRERLFKGNHSADVEGVQANVSWDVLQPPVFDLKPPSGSQWADAIRADGSAQTAPSANGFTVTLPALNVNMSSGSSPPTGTTTAVDVICTIGLSGRIVSVVPLGVLIDLSNASPMDQLIYKQMLIPHLLAQINTMLSGEKIPKIDFRGLAFGNASLLVEGGRAVAAAFLEGNPGTPDVQALRSAPPGAFYVLLGGNALQQVVQAGVQPLRGQTKSVGGNASFGIGSANYSASLRLDSLNAQIRTPTSLRVEANVTLAASAGVDVFAAILDQIKNGVTDAAQAVANVASDSAKKVADFASDSARKVADGVTDTAKKAGEGIKDAANTVAHALSSY
jgi:hypothetical protein